MDSASKRVDGQKSEPGMDRDGVSTPPSEDVEAELRAILEADDTRLGQVYRRLERGMRANAIAADLGVATSRFVWNYERVIKALLRNDLPEAPYVALSAARTFRSFLRRDLSAETRSYLDAALEELEKNSQALSFRHVLQTIYDLLRERNAWPTFRVLDRHLDRRFSIADSQAALAAIPVTYLQRSWGRTGFYDNDEVRLTLSGVNECRGGPEDLELLVALVGWLAVIEQTQDLEDVEDQRAEAVDFATVIGLPVGADTQGLRAETEVGDEEVAKNRAQLARLRVLAELVPRFWTGFGWQESWRWEVRIDSRGIRPYREIHDVEQLIDYAERGEGPSASDDRSMIVRGDGNVIHVHQYNQLPSEGVQRSEIHGGVHVGESYEEPNEIDVLLTILRAEIIEVTRDHVNSGRYDDAIFAAYRRVEAALQSRAGLDRAIGDGLVSQAFGGANPRIRVSDRNQDADRLEQLFQGAIGLYKGDRSHKDKPALPCRSHRECLRQLANASALLDLLDRDLARAPAVRGYDQRGDMLELWVERASAQAQVWIDDRLCDIVRHDPGSLILNVAGVPAGEHDLFVADGTRTGPVTHVWLTRSPGDTGWQRVIEVNIPLFEGATGAQCLSATGIRLEVHKDGVTRERIVPATDSYRVGDYVISHDETDISGIGSGSESPGIGPAYINDGSGSVRRQLWESAAIFEGQPYTPSHGPRLMKVTLEPPKLLLRPKEKAHVRVLGHYTDGVATWNAPLVGCSVTSGNDKVIYAEKGTVIAKGHGRTSLRVTENGLYASAEAHVAAHPTGTLTDVLTGLPSIAGLAWADGGLIVSTRTDQLWKLSTEGKYTLAAAVPLAPSANGGTEALAAGPNGDVAVRLPGHQDVLILDCASGYTKSRWLVPGASGTVTAMAWAGADLLIALDTGMIRRVHADGSSERITVLQDKVIASMCVCGDELQILVTSDPSELFRVSLTAAGGGVTPIRHAPERLEATVVACLSGVSYITDAVGGRLLRLADGNITEVATGLRRPGELAAGPDGSIYVAESGRGAVRRLLP